MIVRLLAFISVLFSTCIAFSEEIPSPDDAPKPLSPEESAAKVHLPEGFRLDLLASEPLVVQPSGVCWDEHGRMFVCELHGYNLEGQYDIEELNKTGKLDREVRRISAPPEAVARAERDQHGVVKLLLDDDGDGLMDRVEVWADDLPPCIGICAARGGVIVACAPDIIYLADRDGDGVAEVREKLFTGFGLGPLERRINHPQHGFDGWIYVGRGKACRVTGPNLPNAVDLPSTDFRIRADGTAIEPITGGTHSVGFTFTGAGRRFVATTSSPGHLVAPLPWYYLARNPFVDPGKLQAAAAGYRRCYPTSAPHPWRQRRADDPDFFKFYKDRYGASESEASGWFTAGCSPMVYRDSALPGLNGQYLVCEPACNLVHRAAISRNGTDIKLQRHLDEQDSEFLASEDIWFHPVALAHAPDGSLVVVDFYREIIEDYSAIPRYLQQQYGLDGGKNRGRIWRLTHEDMPHAQKADLSGLEGKELARELASPRHWRRVTARRLLSELPAPDAVTKTTLEDLIAKSESHETVVAALELLVGWASLSDKTLHIALKHPDSTVRAAALRVSEGRSWSPATKEIVRTLTKDPSPQVRLQLAFSLGENNSPESITALAELLVSDTPYMATAVRSSIAGREIQLLNLFLEQGEAGEDGAETVAAWLAQQAQPDELGGLFFALDGKPSGIMLLKTVAKHLPAGKSVTLSSVGLTALQSLANTKAPETTEIVQRLLARFTPEDDTSRKARLESARALLTDPAASTPNRLSAARQLAAAPDQSTNQTLLSVCSSASTELRRTLLEIVFSHKSGPAAVLTAIESGQVSGALLNDVQRKRLLGHSNPDIQKRAEKFLKTAPDRFAETFARFRDALSDERDATRGADLFRTHCAACHRVGDMGTEFGPPLSGEVARAEEILIKDMLAPSAEISAGYEAYLVDTKSGATYTGLIARELPGALFLKIVGGTTIRIPRDDIADLRTLPASLMPSFEQSLAPQDLADIIAWIRSTQ